MRSERYARRPVDTSRSHSVLIWRDLLLPPSETFIANQIASLREWEPVLGGVREIEGGLPLVSRPRLLLENGDRLAPRFDRRLFWSFGVSGRLMSLLCTVRLAHAHFGPDGSRLVRTARVVHCPLVVTFHGYDITIRRVVSDVGYRPLFRYASHLVAVSHFIRGALELAGAPPYKVRVVPMGIPICEPAKRYTKGGQVLFVGRLVEKKGCADLIRALAAMPNRPTLKIVGDGPLRSSLENLATSLRVEAEFVGTQPPDRVDVEMRRSSVLCVPSQTSSDGDREGFGMVFLEAAARSLPVVSYASGGVPEAVADRETGLLAPERDIPALGRHLSVILEDSALAERLGAEGRRRVERDFNIARCTAQLERVYDEAASRRHR